jgi:hypothetical protein
MYILTPVHNQVDNIDNFIKKIKEISNIKKRNTFSIYSLSKTLKNY